MDKALNLEQQAQSYIYFWSNWLIFDPNIVTIWPFRLTPELILEQKYDQTILEKIVLYMQLINYG